MKKNAALSPDKKTKHSDNIKASAIENVINFFLLEKLFIL